jgi:hypothetical protein
MLEDDLVRDVGREVVDERVKRALRWINRGWATFGALSAFNS